MTTHDHPATADRRGILGGAFGAGALGLVGILPMRATTASPTYAGEAVAWWLPFVGLGVVTAAIAYTTGIGASRRLGSRLASFEPLLHSTWILFHVQRNFPQSREEVILYMFRVQKQEREINLGILS